MALLETTNHRFGSFALALALVAGFTGVAVSSTGCSNAKKDDTNGAAANADAGSNGGNGGSGAHKADAGSSPAETAAEKQAREDAKREAKRGKPVRIGAMNQQVSVLDRMAWPESKTGAKRIGYLRHGSTVEAYEHTSPNEECKEGWYELVGGGYVCAKGATPDLQNPRVRLAPKQPDMNAGMPYRYGVNVVDDTPLYRRALGTDDRKKYEPWLDKPKTPAADESGGGGGGSEENQEAPAAESEKSDKTEKEESTPSTGTGRGNKKSAELDAGVDAGRPKLKELRGRGVLVRKMARGFYLALDKDFRSSGARWWRTTFGLAVPYERIVVQPGVTKYHGTWFGNEDEVGSDADGGVATMLLDGGTRGTRPSGSDDKSTGLTSAGLPGATLALSSANDAGSSGSSTDGGVGADLTNTVAFVTVGFARKLELSADGKKMSWGTELPKRSAVLLNGRETKISGVTYHQTSQGFWVQLGNLNFAKPSIPSDLGPNEKWIDVDVTRQALVAFEGTRPVFATLVSTGRKNPQDKEHDFPTVTGVFRIREKHVTTTMDGDVAADGPYSIEDVPWVMYFEGSYALHGAFWHDQFGRMRSHGCVNLAPEDARTIFGWAEPKLPEGWHGTFSTEEHMGSRIIVHEDPPAKR